MYNEKDITSKNPNKTKRLMKTGAALALAASAFGLSGCATGESTPEQIQPVATSEATPEQTATPEVTPEPQPTTPEELVEIGIIQKSNVEIGTFQLLTPEKQAEMRQLSDMDIETFRAQPYETQLAFGMQVLENQVPILDDRLKTNNIDLQYTENPTTAQEIVDNSVYIGIMADHLIYEDDTANYVFDTELALKFASVIEDVRVTETAAWDNTMLGFTVSNQWSYESDYAASHCTVTSEQTAEDGTLSVECAGDGFDISQQYKQVTYVSMLDGSEKQRYVITDSELTKY